MSERPRVILIGPPASGKTKIGKLVAKGLAAPFLDTDQILVARYGPIPAIFADQGEAWFRLREAEAVAESLTAPGVLSLGGGAVTIEATRTALAGHRVVWLDITEDAVAPRLDNDKRPLLAGGLADWRVLVESRKPLYEEVSEHRVDVSHRPIQEVADDIVAWVESQND